MRGADPVSKKKEITVSYQAAHAPKKSASLTIQFALIKKIAKKK
jgi:hypothetical protein